MKLRTSVLAWAIAIVLAGIAWAQPTNSSLAAAITLFEQGQYDQAHEALVQLDPAGLSDADKVAREQYLGKAKVARNQFAKAIQDRTDADRAFDSGNYDQAAGLYRRVQDNAYATAAMKSNAAQRLSVIDEKQKLTEALEDVEQAVPVEQATPVVQAVPTQRATTVAQTPAPQMTPDTDQADLLLQQAQEAYNAQMWALAAQRCRQSLAIRPSAQGQALLAKSSAEVQQAQEAPSLVQRIRRRNAVSWQKAVAEFRALETRIRADVDAHSFDQASQRLQLARQTIEAAKRYAAPPAAYTDLVAEIDALANFIQGQEQRYEETRVRDQLHEIQKTQEERRSQSEQIKAQRVDYLIEQARLLAKQQEYEKAITALNDLLLIEPTNEAAQFYLDVLNDRSSFHRQGQIRDEYYSQQRHALVDVEEAKIPWHEELRFPKDWQELTERRRRYGAGVAAESESNRKIRRELQQIIPDVNFQGQTLQSVFDQLRTDYDVNISVQWNALEFAGIDRDTEAPDAPLRNVTLEKIIRIILDHASSITGGDIRLSYVVDQGVLTISTDEDLQLQQVTRLYDVHDLLHPVPEEAELPDIDLGDVSSGGGGGGGGGNLFGDTETDTDQDVDELQTELMDLLVNVVAPDTWIDNGGLGSLEVRNGVLFATNSPTVHEQMAALLEQVRELAAIQIAIEARFITVTSNFFEQIGVDLDVILNNGNAGYDYAMSGADRVTDPATGGTLLVPRNNSRLGFLPSVPAFGQPFSTSLSPGQPYSQVGLVPGTGPGLSSSRMTPVPIQGNSLALSDPSTAPTAVPGAADIINNALNNPALNIVGSFLDNLQVDFILRATQLDQKSSVVTAPRIVMLNGRPALIEVAEQRAYVSDLTPVVQENVATFDPQIDSISTGSQLYVQGTVTADRRYVMLNIRPSVRRVVDIFNYIFTAGSVSAASAQIQLPVQQVTSLDTTVTVPDGGTLLLGGQKLADETEVEAGVPLLSKIPILKRAFTNRSKVKNEQTLLILVKPTIIIQAEQEEKAFPTLSKGF